MLWYKRYWLSFIALGVALFNGWWVKDWLWVKYPQNTSQADICIFHANVLFKNKNYERIASQIQKENPDFYSLNETLPASIHFFTTHLSTYPYTYHVHAKNHTEVLLGSKYPFVIDTVATQKIAGLIIANMTLKGKKIKVVLCHAFNPILPSDFDMRNRQLAYIQTLVAPSTTPVVMLGDLNITPWSVFYSKFEQASGLRNARKGFGLQATWPYWVLPLRIPIDHCLVSHQFEVTQFQVLSHNGSDHLPIKISLKCP